MKSFTKLYSNFWINPDNTELVQLGLDTQLMALYLQGNSHHNMLGVYYLPLLYTASDLKLSVKKAQTTLKKLCDISYCKYDAKTQYIWVCNMALEQIGEEIVAKDNKDNKDNRIKSIQAIWNSLPIQIEFLSEIYDKYCNVFNLKSHLTYSSCDKTKNNSAAKNFLGTTEPHQDINIPATITNPDSEKEPSKDDRRPSIFSAIDLSLNLTAPFEWVSCNKVFFQSYPMAESGYNFSKTNISIPLSKGCDIAQEDCLSVSNTISSAQILVDKVEDKNENVTLHPLQGVASFFDPPSKDLINPLEASSKDLQSPSEAPLEPLRSNIEDRSKNIEEINKKKEIEKDLKKTEEKKKTNNVLTSNSIAQIQPYFEKPPEIFNFSFLKTTEDLEKTKKTGAVDAKKQLIANKIHNLPVVTIASELKTNPVPVFSVSSVISDVRNNSVIPAIHIGSVSSTDAIITIFEHWKTTMGYPDAKLDFMRKGYISRALQMGYSVQQLCIAITGCFRTPYNMGINDQGQRYDGIHIILRDADQIDRFIRNYHHPPKPDTEAKKRLRSNIHEVDTWLKSRKGKFNEAKEQFF